MSTTTTATQRLLTSRLISFLRDGQAHGGLFAENVPVDFTPPLWRLQAQGREAR